MTILTANTSPLVPFMFPAFYQEDYQNFVAFVQAYYQWLETTGQAQYYTRRIYDIKDIDNTFTQFIVYFKEKYLKNLQFTTETDIRTVIKHALDIYRSKGTERCTTLLFQLAFDESPDFYYPSTDLFKLSDGVWTQPHYLELNLDWPNNVKLQQKEVQGLFSGATAFVDDIVRRKTNNRLEDVAYISAIFGQFQAGEKIVPTDNSLAIVDCPTLIGSLTNIQIPIQGTGIDYTLNSLVPISSPNGNNAVFLVSNVISQTGEITIDFVDGGFGYQINAVSLQISYNAANGSFANNTNIYSYYGNGAVQGIAVINVANVVNSTVGTLTANLLNGTIGNTIYTYANAIVANVVTQNSTIISPNVYISNATLLISNLIMNTSNLELIYYFNWLDIITEPLAELNYISANGTLLAGANIYTYYSNGSVMGQGIILENNPTTSSSGVLVVSVYSGNLNNTFYTTSNGITANLTASNGYTDITATGNFIANDDSIILNLTNMVGKFKAGEIVYQATPETGPFVDQRIEGWGVIEGFINANAITVSNVVGRLIAGEIIALDIQGQSSGATATVSSADMTIGIVNLGGNGAFIASPYAYIYSSLTSGILGEYVASGSGFSVSIAANNLLYPEHVNLNTDLIADYMDVPLNATAYGFPAYPTANLSTGFIANCFNYANATIGKLGTVTLGGTGTGFNETPFIVIDNPVVSDEEVYDDILLIEGSTQAFTPGEQVTQVATGASGIVYANSNTSFLYLQRTSYANDFILTSNSTTVIVGSKSGASANTIQVDNNILGPIMGRNAVITPMIAVGNNAILNGMVVDSGYGFVNGEIVTLGSNGGFGTAIVASQGTGTGYYSQKGGFLSDQKKLFDGYYWQNFSYVIISPLMVSQYYQMIQELTHVAGTIMFGEYIHNSVTNSSSNIQEALIHIANSSPSNNISYYYYLGF